MTNNKLETLSSLARWKAFVRKYRGFTSNVEDEKKFIDTLHDYQKRWISNGEGTPLVKVKVEDILEAIIDFNVTPKEISKCGVEDLKLYFEAIYALEYDGEDV